jgi:hypothetical protein
MAWHGLIFGWDIAKLAGECVAKGVDVLILIILTPAPFYQLCRSGTNLPRRSRARARTCPLQPCLHPFLKGKDTLLNPSHAGDEQFC